MKKKKKSTGETGLVLRPLRQAEALRPWAEYLAGIDPWKSLQITPEKLFERWTSSSHQWQFFTAADPKAAKEGGFANQDGLIVFTAENGKPIIEGILKAPLDEALGDGGYVAAVGTRVRQKGVGKYLLSAAERVISDRFPRVFLFVSESNVAAQKFYKNLGYEEVGKARDVFVSGNNEILMTKKLSD